MLGIITGWMIQSALSSVILVIAFVGVRSVFKSHMHGITMKVLYGLMALSLLFPNVLKGDFGVLNQVERIPAVTGFIANSPILYHCQDLNVNQSLNLLILSHSGYAADAVISEKIAFTNGVAVLWALGFCLTATIWLITSWMVTKELQQSLKEIDDAELQRLFIDLKTQLKVKKDVRLCQSTFIKAPAIYNAAETAVVIPAEMVERLTQEEYRYIFSHELYHLKNHDLIWNLLLIILRGLFWFNPMVWWLAKLYHQDREMMCDNNVTHHYAEEERYGYCQCLLKCIGLQRHKNIDVCIGFFNKSTALKKNLTYRLERILNPLEKNEGVLCNLMIVSIALALLTPLTDHQYVVSKKYESSKSFEAYEVFRSLEIEQGIYIAGNERCVRKAKEQCRVLYIGKSHRLGQYIVLQKQDQSINMLGKCGNIQVAVGQDVQVGQVISMLASQ